MRDRSRDLERLADLLVGFGANLQPGQILGVTAYYDMAEVTRAVARAAYRRGARYVDVFWWDMLIKRARLEHAAEDTLEYVPPWVGERLRWLSDERAARLSLTGTDSTVFDGIDPARTGRDLLPYVREIPEIVNERTTNWTAGPCPNPRWAERVHPDLPAGRGAREALGRDRLGLPARHPTTPWRPGASAWRRSSPRADRLTERRFDAIHLKGPGTDLTVGLFPSSRWLGADFTTADGLTHYSNIPTEEAFTTPDPERVDGDVSATRPLEVYGSLSSGIKVSSRAAARRRSTRTRAARRCARRRARRGASGSASSHSSTRRAASARSAPSSTRRCWTRTRPATSRSATPTPSRSRTRPTRSA